MTTLLKTLIGIGICLASTVANAQTINRITGKVADTNNKPVNAATISLLKPGQAVPVKFELSDSSGAFIFESPLPGTYLITVTALGLVKYESNTFTVDSVNTQVTLPTFAMAKADIELKEVAVTGKKSFVEQKIDRTVVNVDAMISNAGVTALEVLEKSPGVRVDQNGTISLKGQQGVTIYIDDKPTYLAGADLQNYLRSMPSSSLSQIEIMTNPPAKYDAAGNGGVLNIKTVKRKIKGFNLGLSLGPRISKYTSINNSLDFNYRNNKFNIFGNLAYGLRNSYNDVDISRRYKNDDGSTRETFNQNSYIRRTGYGFKSTLGADYYPSEKTTIGVIFTGLIRYPINKNTSTGTIADANGQPQSSVLSENNEDGKFKNGGVNLNFMHEFSKDGPSLLGNFDYLTYSTNNDQLFTNKNFASDGSLQSVDKLDGHLPGEIKIYAAKLDYSLPLKHDWKLEAGGKTSYTKTTNIANYFNTIEEVREPDYDKTNHFNYEENINAAYLNLNKDFNRLSVQLGLRFESTSSKGHQLGNVMKPDSSFDRNYNNLFPTLFLLYKLDSLSNHQIKFNYGRRIDRPYYQDLNPFISPLDKFTYYVGNPYLLPSFSSKYEFGYIFKNKITATLGYSDTKDQVSETIEIEGNNYYSRPGNIGHTKITTIGLDGGFDPTPWFSFQLSGQMNFVNTQSDFYKGQLDVKGSYLYAQGLLQFKLKKNWAIQLDGFYQSELPNAQFVTAPKGRVNAGVAKVLSPKATLKASFTDIFFTNINEGTINNLDRTDARFRTLTDSRAVVLTLSLRFGKAVKGQRKHNNSSADTEQNRVKN